MLNSGGGLAGQNVIFYKVVFKIHFKPFWVILEKNTPHFSPILAIQKIIFAKVPQKWGGVSRVKTIHFIKLSLGTP